jgi:hypothetical protein
MCPSHAGGHHSQHSHQPDRDTCKCHITSSGSALQTVAGHPVPTLAESNSYAVDVLLVGGAPRIETGNSIDPGAAILTPPPRL